MTKETAEAACQVMQAEKQLQMERSIEAASIKQLQIIEQQMKDGKENMRPNDKELKERLATFKNEMLHTLEKAKNKQKGGWQNANNIDLLHCLQHEVFELYEAIINDKKNISRECYDIANFAFMISDNESSRTTSGE